MKGYKHEVCNRRKGKNGLKRNLRGGIHWIQEWSRIERDMGIREKEDSGMTLGFLVLVILWATVPYLETENTAEDTGL